MSVKRARALAVESFLMETIVKVIASQQLDNTRGMVYSENLESICEGILKRDRAVE